MTLKKSLVNKSLILSDLKRFKWGSIVYLIILFLSTNLVFLTQMPFGSNSYLDEWLQIMTIFTTTLIVGVSAVVGLLTFRRQSSKKQLFFERALPIKEEAALISHTISGLILMLAPLFVNGIIMMLVSLLDLSGGLNIYVILGHLGWTTLATFLLFSFVCVSNTLTGNPFAGIVLNGILHSLPFMIIAVVESFGEKYLKGFSAWNSAISTFIRTNTPIVKLYGLEGDQKSSNAFAGIIYLIIFAIVLYAISIIAGTKRKAERVETMICFSKLAVVLKYLLTFLSASLLLIILDSFGLGDVFTMVFIAFASIIIYFGIEMLQRKSVHVFKSAYGYAALAIVFIGLNVLMANTTFFGFETKVPAKSSIAEASICERWTDTGITVKDPNYIDYVLKKHKQFIEEEPAMPSYTQINICYVLKSGIQINRCYKVNDTELEEIRDACANNEEFTNKFIKAYGREQYQWSFRPDLYDTDAIEPETAVE